MTKILINFTILLLILGCNSIEKEKKQYKIKDKTSVKKEQQVDTEKEVENKTVINSENEQSTKKITLTERLTQLKTGCLDIPKDSIFYSEERKSRKFVDRKAEKWLFGLENIDSLQFDQADLIIPICKLEESSKIVSVLFCDIYDYKEALHIFNFRKSDYKPISSFILYSTGGDAEDFWRTEYKKLDNWTYELTEINGRYHYGTKKTDTTFIDLRRTKKITIDESTGEIKKGKGKTERDIIIVE